MSDEIFDLLRRYVNAGDDACIAGTPMIPIAQETLRYVVERHDKLADALETAIALIEDAEKDTNWVSGDPYGDSATVRLRKALGETAAGGV